MHKLFATTGRVTYDRQGSIFGCVAASRFSAWEKTMNFLIYVKLIELIDLLLIIFSIWALYRLFPATIRSVRAHDYKSSAVMLVVMLIFVGVGWLTFRDLFPPFESMHKKGLHVGYNKICQEKPKYVDCALDKNCPSCMSRQGCGGAVDKYFDDCFDVFFVKRSEMSSKDFISSLNICINNKSGCEYFSPNP
jgi:hypothetical protein